MVIKLNRKDTLEKVCIHRSNNNLSDKILILSAER